MRVDLPREEDAAALAAALAGRGIDAQAAGLVVQVSADACEADELGSALDDWLADAPEPMLVPERVDERTWALRPPLA